MVYHYLTIIVPTSRLDADCTAERDWFLIFLENVACIAVVAQLCCDGTHTEKSQKLPIDINCS